MVTNDKNRPLERRVFREEIREKLIEEILSGESSPRLPHRRDPHRPAVRRQPGPGARGAARSRALRLRRQLPFPRHPGPQDLDRRPARDLSDPRRARSVAARSAALLIDDATFEHLEEFLGAMRDASARDDAHAQAAADASFHHVIIRAAGNRMLEHVWQSMRLSITTCVTHAVTHKSLHEITERHVPLLDALRSRDPNRAEAEIRRHIEEPGEWIRAAAAQEQVSARAPALRPRRPDEPQGCAAPPAGHRSSAGGHRRNASSARAFRSCWRSRTRTCACSASSSAAMPSTRACTPAAPSPPRSRSSRSTTAGSSISTSPIRRGAARISSS